MISAFQGSQAWLESKALLDLKGKQVRSGSHTTLLGWAEWCS